MADIFVTLRKDHEELRRMLLNPGRGVTELLSEVSRDLPASLEAEDTVFYAHLEKSEELESLVAEARERQRRVRTVALELLEDIGSKEESEALLDKLREAVFSHFDEEEGALFEKARDVLDAGQAVALGAEFERVKIRVEGRLTGARPC